MKVPSAGSILVITLVFFLIFVVIMMAWLRFATLQNHAVVSQEQEEQSFHLSEAGVNWALHVLNSGACTPADLAVYSSEPVIASVVDETVPGGDVIGTYQLTFNVETIGGETETSVRAIGYDKNVEGECQLIEATIQSFGGVLGTKYRIEAWDHKSTISCGVPGAIREPVC